MPLTSGVYVPVPFASRMSKFKCNNAWSRIAESVDESSKGTTSTWNV